MSTQPVEAPKTKSFLLKIVVGLVLLAFVGAGAAFYFYHSAQSRVEQFLSHNGMRYGSLEVNRHRHFVAHDVKLSVAQDRDVLIETVKGDVSLSASKSKNLELQNVSYKQGNTQISIPSLKIHNFTSGKSPNNGSLSGFIDVEIGKADIETLSLDIVTDNYKQKVIYDNIVVTDVKDGLIGKITSDSLSTETDVNKNTVTTLKTGKSAIENLNIANIVDFCTKSLPNRDDNNPFKDFFGSWVVNDIKIGEKFDDGAVEKATFKAISGSKFSARLLSFSLTQYYDEQVKRTRGKPLDPATRAKYNNNNFEILSAIGAADIHIMGFEINDQETKMGIGDFTTSYNDGRYNTAIGDITINTPDGNLSLKNFSLSDVSFPAIIRALRKINNDAGNTKNDLSDMIDEAKIKNPLIFCPRFKKIHMDGLKFVDDENSSIALDSMDIDADFSLGVIPTSLRIVFKGVDFPIAELSSQPGSMLSISDVKMLEDFGYENFTFDMVFDTSWNKDTETLTLNEFSYKIANFASYTLKATFLSVNRAFFSDNVITIGTAFIGFRIHDIDMSLNVDPILKLSEKYYERKTGHNFRKDREEAAEKISSLIERELGEEYLQKFGRALEDFTVNGGTLNVHAKTKSDKGFGLLEFSASNNQILEMLNRIDLRADVKH